MPDHLQEPFAFVIFGASGDLSRRKLIPAIHHLADLGYMPEKYAVIGTSRSPMTDDAFRNLVRQAIEEHESEEKTKSRPDTDRLLPFVHYQPGDTTKVDSFSALKTKLDQLDKQLGLRGNRLFYLAVSPELAPAIDRKSVV